jgi:hypothetical protein
MGAMRHRDSLLCPQGELAQYLFWRWHISGEQPPSFQSRQDWYQIKMLVGRDRNQEISYPTQLDDVFRAFIAAGITSMKKTHAMRGCGARVAELHGVSEKQIQRAGRWDSSSLINAYLTGLPVKFLRVAAGFHATQGSYYLRRAALLPPASLQLQIWPWLEGWEERFNCRIERKCWKEGGLGEDDLAGHNFVRLLKHLRVVLLQDLAVLQPRFPTLPLFTQPLFWQPEWQPFASAVWLTMRMTRSRAVFCFSRRCLRLALRCIALVKHYSTLGQ